MERCLLFGGLAALGVWTWSVASQAVFQDWGNWAFDRQMQGQRATVPGYLAAKKAAILGDLRAAPRRAEGPAAGENRAASNDSLVGRLSIPRLNLSAMVREGVGESTLRLALGHIPGTAFPGQNGNVGVAGHRDTFFRGLREIRANDRIQIETIRGKYTYAVESTEIVNPRNVSVLEAGEHPELTLVTCYPFYYVGAAPDRFIVKARQVPDVTPAAGQAAVAPPEASPRRVAFEVRKGSSRQLAPGISLGVTDTLPWSREVSGWMWVMPDRRTIWLRDQSVRQPVIFYGRLDGRKRELRITRVAADSVAGYLILPDRGVAAPALRAPEPH